MRVERSTLDEVQTRLEYHKRKKDEEAAAAPTFQARRPQVGGSAAPRDCARHERVGGLQTGVRDPGHQSGWASTQACIRAARAAAPHRARQERVALREEEEEALRQSRKERKLEKKKEKEKLLALGNGGVGDEDGIDPEMAAMMGFAGFTAKK